MLDPQKIQKGDFVSLKLDNGTKVEGTAEIVSWRGFYLEPFDFMIGSDNGVYYYHKQNRSRHTVTITSIGRSHPCKIEEEA